jgi:TolB-like protein
MKKWIFLLFGVLFFSTSIQAEIVTVQARGTGETYEKAVNAALSDAVRQVNGVSVSSQSEQAGNYVKVQEKASANVNIKSNEKKDDGQKSDENSDGADAAEIDNSIAQILDMGVDVDAKGQRDLIVNTGTSERLDVSAYGQIKGYSVLERDCSDTGCSVLLSVQINKVARKDSQSEIKRDRIAIITTGNSRNSNFAQQLQQKLTDNLVKSSRFVVLSRTAANDKAFKQEEAFLEGRLNNASDMKQSTLAADYILSINVTQAGVTNKTEYNYIDMTGELNIKRSSKTRVKVSYALLEASTYSIKWSDSIEFNQYGRALQKSQDELTKTILDGVVNSITPAKIVGVSNGRVIINRGEGIVKAGDVFDIYATGEALIDPDTNEILGTTEEKVASIIIETVNPKLSYGRLTIGRIDAINKGDIVRAAIAEVQEKPAVKSTTKTVAVSNGQQIGSSGGIILK